MDYTLRQFSAYVDLARTRQREALRTQLLATFFATNGGEGLIKMLKKLGD
jgi:hypothetical protein